MERLASVLIFLGFLAVTTAAFSLVPHATTHTSGPRKVSASPSLVSSSRSIVRFVSDNDDATDSMNEEWSDFAELPQDIGSDSTPKLGIPIELDPLTEQEAMELKAEATELINEKIAQGVDDIRVLREELQKELVEAQKLSTLQSERRTQQESDRLMSKIDSITSDFLGKTESMRTSTKLAAKADQNSAGKGAEFGSWGVLSGGAAVRMSGSSVGTLLGSVDAAKKSTESATSTSADASAQSAGTESRVLIVADASQDPLAKKLIPSFTEILQDVIPSVSVEMIKPTSTVPLGGDNAQCVVVFTTSYNDRSGLQNALDRLMRRTMQPGGGVATPPTQLVCVSTLGTERTDKMPYSMQNLMGGGKLEKRRQMEECVIKAVQQRVTDPPLDFTICKVSEQLSEKKGGDFVMKPGDVLDGATDATTAAYVLMQAVALQPAARNSTLCVTGCLDESDLINDEMWNDAFLQLDGPELLRIDDASMLGDSSKFQQLVEYMNEWALMLESGQKLTTPIRVESSSTPPNPQYEGAAQRGGVRLLFLPTRTGSAYLSRDEEQARERDLRGGGATGAKSVSSSKAPPTKSRKREGGIEVLVEVTTTDALRVRARRCNMADETVVKELSEETILKRLTESIDVWQKQL